MGSRNKVWYDKYINFIVVLMLWIKNVEGGIWTHALSE